MFIAGENHVLQNTPQEVWPKTVSGFEHQVSGLGLYKFIVQSNLSFLQSRRGRLSIFPVPSKEMASGISGQHLDVSGHAGSGHVPFGPGEL